MTCAVEFELAERYLELLREAISIECKEFVLTSLDEVSGWDGPHGSDYHLIKCQDEHWFVDDLITAYQTLTDDSSAVYTSLQELKGGDVSRLSEELCYSLYCDTCGETGNKYIDCGLVVSEDF